MGDHLRRMGKGEGPKVVPWGVSEETGKGFDVVPLRTKPWVLVERRAAIW